MGIAAAAAFLWERGRGSRRKKTAAAWMDSRARMGRGRDGNNGRSFVGSGWRTEGCRGFGGRAVVIRILIGITAAFEPLVCAWQKPQHQPRHHRLPCAKPDFQARNARCHSQGINMEDNFRNLPRAYQATENLTRKARIATRFSFRLCIQKKATKKGYGAVLNLAALQQI